MVLILSKIVKVQNELKEVGENSNDMATAPVQEKLDG